MAKPGIYLEAGLLDSQAFKSLKTWDYKCLFEFFRRRQIKKDKRNYGKKKMVVILNNGKIEFTYKDAIKYGFSEKQFRDAIDTLIDRGFLEITHQGTGTGDPSFYYISNRWTKWGTDEFKPVPLERRRRKRTTTDSGWAKFNQKQKSTAKKDSGSTGSFNRRFQKKLWKDVQKWQ